MKIARGGWWGRPGGRAHLPFLSLPSTSVRSALTPIWPSSSSRAFSASFPSFFLLPL